MLQIWNRLNHIISLNFYLLKDSRPKSRFKKHGSPVNPACKEDAIKISISKEGKSWNYRSQPIQARSQDLLEIFSQTGSSISCIYSASPNLLLQSMQRKLIDLQPNNNFIGPPHSLHFRLVSII
jgi:hypothetical protein